MKKETCCEETLECSNYGHAVKESYFDEEGCLWVTNFEYASRVRYCPFCGAEERVNQK